MCIRDRPDAARHRRRGRGGPAPGGAHDGRADRGEPGRGAPRLRALDPGREARGVHRSTDPIPEREETDMANVLFTNVRIIDATGAQPYTGEVLVQGCLLYTSDAADERSSVDRGGRRI